MAKMESGPQSLTFVPMCCNCFNEVISAQGGLVLSCGDFLLSFCEKTCDFKQCPGCNKQGIRSLRLSEELPSQVIQNMADVTKQLDTVHGTLMFQFRHYKISVKRAVAKLAKFSNSRHASVQPQSSTSQPGPSQAGSHSRTSVTPISRNTQSTIDSSDPLNKRPRIDDLSNKANNQLLRAPTSLNPSTLQKQESVDVKMRIADRPDTGTSTQSNQTVFSMRNQQPSKPPIPPSPLWTSKPGNIEHHDNQRGTPSMNGFPVDNHNSQSNVIRQSSARHIISESPKTYPKPYSPIVNNYGSQSDSKPLTPSRIRSPHIPIVRTPNRLSVSVSRQGTVQDNENNRKAMFTNNELGK